MHILEQTYAKIYEITANFRQKYESELKVKQL